MVVTWCKHTTEVFSDHIHQFDLRTEQGSDQGLIFFCLTYLSVVEIIRKRSTNCHYLHSLPFCLGSILISLYRKRNKMKTGQNQFKDQFICCCMFHFLFISSYFFSTYYTINELSLLCFVCKRKVKVLNNVLEL